MRIGMVLPNLPYPPDIRVDKEAEVLVAAGHEVVLLCRGDGVLPAEERVGPLEVVRHRVHPDTPLRRRVDSAIFHATMDSPSWRHAMMSLVTDHGAQALHLHDLPYAPSLVRAARATGVPAVLDLHENYPAAIALWGRRRSSRLLFSPTRAARLERRVIHEVDRVVVVVEEARERLLSLGADPATVHVFGNMEPRGLVPDRPIPLDFSNGLHIVYVGGVAPHRGLDTAVDAMPAVLEREPSAMLTIVGAGESLAGLKERVAGLGIGDNVRFTGFLPLSEAMERIREANVTLVPHHRSPHTDSTIPHKLFQYMALGRPVIVSDCAPLARVVRETGSGLVFRASDPDDLAARLLEMTETERAEAMAAAGRAAVLDKWNLETDASALTGLYDELP